MDENLFGAIVVGAGVTMEFVPLMKKGAEFVGGAVGRPLGLASGLVSDQLYSWKLSRALTMAGKAQERIAHSKVKPRKLNPSYLFGMLNAAAESDDDDIHSLLADLLASAVAEDAYQHPIYRHAATQMNGEEARMVAALASLAPPRLWSHHSVGTQPLLEADLNGLVLKSPSSMHFYVENLQRLGLIAAPQPEGAHLSHCPEEVRQALAKLAPAMWPDSPMQAILKWNLPPTNAGRMMARAIAGVPLKQAAPPFAAAPLG